MVALRLKELLDELDVSVYRLEKECRKVGRTALYEMASGRSSGVRFASLSDIVETLRRITGRPIGVSDLLLYCEDTPPT